MTEDTRSWLLRAAELLTGLEEVRVVLLTGLELELTELELEPRLLELLLMAELTAPDTKGWICETTEEMRSSWEKEEAEEEDCWPDEREEEPAEKELEAERPDEREEEPDEKLLEPEPEPELDEDKEELPELEELKLEAGLSLI